MKRVAIVFNQMPHGNSYGREALDLALALSDINHITVFFIGNGVLHLLPNQKPDKILMRNYIATLSMLELYDINDIYVCQDSLIAFNLTEDSLIINSQIITKPDIVSLFTHQDCILQF